MEREAILNKKMLISVVLAVIIMEYTFYKYDINAGGTDVLYLITLPMALSMFGPYAGLFPTLPYALSFVEEYNSFYYCFILIRSSRKKYALKKVLNVGMSGGVMMIVAFMIIFVSALLMGTPTITNCISEFYEGTIWYPIAAVWGGKLVLLLKLMLAFLFGLVWSNVCLLFTIVSLNRYVAFISTFILYQFLWQNLSGTKLNPVYLLRADIVGYASFWEPFFIQLIIFTVLCALNWIGIMRRIEIG